MSSAHSAFNWKLDQRPSIFATDPAFLPNKSSGKTQSQTSSEFVTRHIKATGRSPGSIKGISAQADARIEQTEHDRRRGRRG